MKGIRLCGWVFVIEGEATPHDLADLTAHGFNIVEVIPCSDKTVILAEYDPFKGLEDLK